MKQPDKGINTKCTHDGELHEGTYKGAVAPLYMSTSYAYENVEVKRYPRYFNTPNQVALGEKLAALEGVEEAIIFSSGMAAISTALLAHLQKGDHVVIQPNIYGGTYNLVTQQFKRFGIEYTFAESHRVEDLEQAIKQHTKVMYVESPSNPLLDLTDLQAVASLCEKRGLLSMIDNTFASPVNQNPASLGIDLILHSATKYMGGHSDISAGVVAGSAAHMEPVMQMARSLGGNLSEYTVWLLERSLKTMGIRVRAQNENALKMASWLEQQDAVEQVYYPGLESHPDHKLAKAQMSGYGGMLSFRLAPGIDPSAFQEALQLVKPSMSLAGVESTLLQPSKTSHALLPAEEREKQGITDRLIRFSLGIEDFEDLKADLQSAFELQRKRPALT